MITADFDAVVARSQRLPTELHAIIEFIGADVLGPGGSWITGGTVRRAIEAVESDADIDIYSATPEARDIIRERLRARDAQRVWGNDVNELFKGPTGWRFDVSSRVFAGDLSTCLEGFDYTICQFGVWCEGGRVNLMCGLNSLHDLLHRALMPNEGGVYSLDMLMRRSRKYHAQGFAITPASLAEYTRILRAKPHLLQEI